GESHVQHHQAAPVGLLEHAVAVAKAAIGRRHGARAAGREIEGGQRMEAVLDLGPVGADVLDRRGAHRARDQRHVFQ
nr:hypothetical protein [Tanacetum cinerariifolium]